MFDSKIFDELAEKLSKVIPPEVRAVQEDVKSNFSAILQSYFSKLNLVTREEFDTQAGVLAKTRDKLDKLEKQIAELSKKSEQ